MLGLVRRLYLDPSGHSAHLESTRLPTNSHTLCIQMHTQSKYSLKQAELLILLLSLLQHFHSQHSPPRPSSSFFSSSPSHSSFTFSLSPSPFLWSASPHIPSFPRLSLSFCQGFLWYCGLSVGMLWGFSTLHPCHATLLDVMLEVIKVLLVGAIV